MPRRPAQDIAIELLPAQAEQALTRARQLALAPHRPLDLARAEAVRELRAAGCTVRQAARLLGVSPETCHRVTRVRPAGAPP